MSFGRVNKFLLVFCFLSLALFFQVGGAVAQTGVLLLHGKAHGTNSIDQLSNELISAGFLVEKPSSTPWSPKRIYDRTYLDTLKELDTSIEKLRAAGASRIVVGGHSIGANVALGYAANREDLAGVIIIGAGHFISGNFMGKKLKGDVSRANKMIASGKGKEKANFDDINQRKTTERSVTADIYQSWFDPDGPANIRNNTANLSVELPVLWIAGKDDKVASKVLKRLAYDKMASHPKNRFVIVDGGHKETPAKAGEIVINWLNKI